MSTKILEEDMRFPQHMPDTHLDTVGHDIVRADLLALEHEIKADQFSASVEAMNKLLQEKKLPEKATRVERLLGKLGIGTVMTDEEAARVAVARDDLDRGYTDPEKHREQAEVDRAFVASRLDDARQALRQLDRTPAVTAVEASASIFKSMSPFQRTLFSKAKYNAWSELSVFTWLAEQRSATMPEDTEEQRRAKRLQEQEDDQRLLNFLQSHNEYIATHQNSPEFSDAVQEQKAVWSVGAKTALKKGYLHEQARSSLERVADVDVYEGDYFTTDFSHRSGYYRRGDVKQVCVARDEVEYATVHELNHALLETYGGDRILGQEWLFEAITEELALSFKSGSFGEFNTWEGAYEGPRRLLKTVLDLSDQLGAGVTFADFTYMYSAPQEEKLDLIQAINKKFHDNGHPDVSMLGSLADIFEDQYKQASVMFEGHRWDVILHHASIKTEAVLKDWAHNFLDDSRIVLRPTN